MREKEVCCDLENLECLKSWVENLTREKQQENLEKEQGLMGVKGEKNAHEVQDVNAAKDELMAASKNLDLVKQKTLLHAYCLRKSMNDNNSINI